MYIDDVTEEPLLEEGVEEEPTVDELQTIEGDPETDGPESEDGHSDVNTDSASSSEDPLLVIYKRQMTGYPVLSREKEHELALAMRKGDVTARELFIKHNLRLVWKIAAKFLWSGFDLADLIQEGNIGLLTAVKKFDPARGFKFSTMATWWIKQNIHRAIADTGRTIRMPVHTYEKVVQLQRREGEKSKVGSKISPAQAAKIHMLDFSSRTVSLDALKGINKHGEEVEINLPDKKELSPEQVAIVEAEFSFVRLQLEKFCSRARECLDDRAISLVLKRVGISEPISSIPTLHELGREYGITRERIRQICSRDVWRRLKKSGSGVGYSPSWLEEMALRYRYLYELCGKSELDFSSTFQDGKQSSRAKHRVTPEEKRLPKVVGEIMRLESEVKELDSLQALFFKTKSHHS